MYTTNTYKMGKDFCKYTKKCPIYQGETLSNEHELTVYKNVFCQRGIRGWKNCKQFLIYENSKRSSEQEL